MPKHIGIIVDGNRRWAKHNTLTAVDTYRLGADKLEQVLDWCIELGIQTVTVYVLSTENFNRTKEDLDSLYKVLEERLERLFHDERVYRNQIRIKAIGKLEMLPERIMNLINRLEDVTRDYNRHYLNIAVAYGGRAEILESIRSIAGNIARGEIDPNKISEQLIEQHLYTYHLPHPDPDLIIRTSGESRLSGFLLWQSAYSELIFADTLWPEFRRIDLLRAIRTYQARQRRYGV
jgi:tritrans,polycis-undecaprenyl-diphosphate synthase [geranylgeranyl-diphosphate specific]